MHFIVFRVVHIINIIYSPFWKNKSHFHLQHSRPPTLLHVKYFGCLAHASTLYNHRTKFQTQARKTVFLGYRDVTKGFLLYDIHSHEFLFSRNVIFYDNVFPFANILSEGISPILPNMTNHDADLDFVDYPILIYVPPIQHDYAHNIPHLPLLLLNTLLEPETLLHTFKIMNTPFYIPIHLNLIHMSYISSILLYPMIKVPLLTNFFS